MSRVRKALSKLKRGVYKALQRVNRNSRGLMGNSVERRIVNLEWWSGAENLGDAIAPVIFEWMLRQRNIEKKKQKKHFI